MLLSRAKTFNQSRASRNRPCDWLMSGLLVQKDTIGCVVWPASFATDILDEKDAITPMWQTFLSVVKRQMNVAGSN